MPLLLPKGRFVLHREGSVTVQSALLAREGVVSSYSLRRLASAKFLGSPGPNDVKGPQPRLFTMKGSLGCIDTIGPSDIGSQSPCLLIYGGSVVHAPTAQCWLARGPADHILQGHQALRQQNLPTLRGCKRLRPHHRRRAFAIHSRASHLSSANSCVYQN